MNKIYVIAFFVFLISCKKDKCTLSKEFSNFEVIPTAKQLKGVYSSSDKKIIINVIPNEDDEFAKFEGEILINRKIKNDSCTIRGTFKILSLGDGSKNFDDDFFLMVEFENSSYLDFIILSKYKNEPVILLDTYSVNPEKCEEVSRVVTNKCSYIILKRE